MARLGIIACQILELELAYLLFNDVEVSNIIVLDTGFGDGFLRALKQKGVSVLRLTGDMGKCLSAEPGRLEVIVQIIGRTFYRKQMQLSLMRRCPSVSWRGMREASC